METEVDARTSSEAGAADGRSPSRPMIQLESVCKKYGDFVAVEEASFEIGEGEFFSLLGPSGCGKTTTLRMIAGFELPTSGAIRLDGEDVSRVPPYRRNVNTVFQQYALFPHMTVAENVAFGLRARKVGKTEARRQALEMLEIVHLGDFGDRRPGQLSGGQQQRVALARALVNRPKALLLDEPLGALDLKLRQSMQLELKRIQRELGITFVFVTHDQEEALTMSDRIAVMTQGRADQIGTPSEIYYRPATVFVAGFIGTANLLPVKVVASEGEVAAVVTADGAALQVPAGRVRLAPGTDATVMIRPERLDLSAAPPEGEVGGVLQGTLLSVLFQGPVLRCEVAGPTGTTLVAHVHVDDLPADVRPGGPVALSWRLDGAALVAEPIPAEQAGVTVVADEEGSVV